MVKDNLNQPVVRIIKPWNWPDLWRQTPLGDGCWDNIRFTLDDVAECDYAVILNYPNKKISFRCPKGHVWAIMQEPFIPGTFDWMIRGHKNYDKVFSHHIPNSNLKYIFSQPTLPWHVNKSFAELIKISPPPKSNLISIIASDKTHFPGHQKRLGFLDYLKKSSLHFDIYGKGINFIDDKWDGLAPYKYSIAIENDQTGNYWTEKLADCFLAWTVPFYFGCTNIADYFPPDSYVTIDINKPEEAVRIIKEEINADNWQKRQPAIQEARNLVLYKYQLFPFLTEKIKKDRAEGLKKAAIQLTPPKGRSNFGQALARRLFGLVKN